MIVARHYGWNAVSDEPMDYHEFLLALHLLAEERYGHPVRQQQRSEDAQLKQSLKQQVNPHGRTGR